MPALATMTLVTSLMGVIDKILDKTPNFEQKQKLKWEEIKNLVMIERAKPREDWDADAMLNLHDKLREFERTI